MKVSVIIPCYNLGEYLKEALDSVRAQSFKDYEIIIVDDGSDDPKTMSVINELKSQPNLKIIIQKNSGPAAARNRGIDLAKGEYIVCLDADDILAPSYLEVMVATLDDDKSKKIGFVTCWLREFGARENTWKTSEYNVAKILVTNIAHAGSMFRKSAWNKAGGYKERRDLQGYEDWEFWLSLVEKGYKWVSLPRALFLYRIREHSLLSDAKSNHLEKYQIIYDLHPNLFSKYARELALENATEIKELHGAIKSKNESISELEQVQSEVVDLREELFQLRDQLNNMRNSRVLGKIIKARDFFGSLRQRISPVSIAQQIRVVGAPIIPGPMRRSLKRLARKMLRPHVRIDVINNKRWPERALISVIVPFYNRAYTIDDTISSLENQTFQNFETIIVNDGSTDPNSVKKFKTLTESSLKPILVNQKNQGVAASRNNGIKLAAGKYIICLDSDDAIAATYIEKATALLETNPNISLVTTYQQIFGITNELFKNEPYDAIRLLRGNTVITAAQFTREGWETVGGYKTGIGYEDWEFWVNLSEHGYWGKLIPEPLFYYRTAIQSRFVQDKEAHWSNIQSLQKLHPNYRKNVKQILSKSLRVKKVADPGSAFINLRQKDHYKLPDNDKKNILILVPWMTFGGAETLILNFCREISNKFNLTFMTGLDSEHEWEYKFREITERIYHLANLFEDQEYYLEFISNYIATRDINTVHIIHNNWAFPLLAELKQRHPKLRVIATLFNDRAHFEEAMAVFNLIDGFTTDNNSVYQHYLKRLPKKLDVRVIPNAVNSSDIYNPLLYDRKKHRQELGLSDKDMAVFFIGRLAEEKNPGAFLEVARQIVKRREDVKFFIIGDGALMSEVKKTIADINSNNIHYLGYKAEVAGYLSAADIFVLPSVIEGFPLSILEAMAMRVIVIASDVGAVAEVIENGKDGFIVEPGSVPSIIDIIDTLANDPRLFKVVKRNARSKVESKYSNIVLGRNYAKLYRDFTK